MLAAAWVVVPLLCTFALMIWLCLCPSPTHLLVHGGPLWVGRYRKVYLISTENLSVAGARGGDLLGVAMVTPFICICLHLLIACFAVNWHLPSILNIAYQQVHKSRKMSYMYVHYSSSFECINSHINSQTFNAENTKTLTYKLSSVIVWKFLLRWLKTVIFLCESWALTCT